jgi:hypothetical protein
MTHYMGLLVDNSPWNLIMFMAIPVILAETIAVTELVLLFNRNLHGWVRRVNKLSPGCILSACLSIYCSMPYYPLQTAVNGEDLPTYLRLVSISAGSFRCWA